MAVDKPEVRMSQLLDMIAMPFQRLTPHYRGPGIKWCLVEYRPIYIRFNGRHLEFPNSSYLGRYWEFLEPENGD